MSRSSRIKQIKEILGNDNPGGDLNSMFEEMMGMKDSDVNIILPKFVKTRNLTRHVYKILTQFSNFTPLRMDFPELEDALNQIKVFADQIKESICFKDTGSDDAEETEDMYKTVTKETLNALYKKLKENSIIKQLIVLCGKLKPHSKYFEDMNNLKDNFIGQEPGLSFVIFPFSTLDLKKLWASNNIKIVVKKYILTILCILYKDLFNIYKITTSPDVNIESFTSILLDSIKKLRRQPGLDRCKNAFNKIEDSVGILKNNFDDYYRESIASENPNMLVESFIVDVSNQSNADARLTREFREIIKYMHKAGAQNGRNKDPKVQKIFSMLNQSFAMMDNKSKSNVEKNPEKGSKSLDDMDLPLFNSDNDLGSDLTVDTVENNVKDVKAVKPSKAQKRRDKKKNNKLDKYQAISKSSCNLDNTLNNSVDSNLNSRVDDSTNSNLNSSNVAEKLSYIPDHSLDSYINNSVKEKSD